MSTGGIKGSGSQRPKQTGPQNPNKVKRPPGWTRGTITRSTSNNTLKTGYWKSFKASLKSSVKSLFNRSASKGQRASFSNKLRRNCSKAVNQDLNSKEPIVISKFDSRVSQQFMRDVFERTGRSLTLVDETQTQKKQIELTKGSEETVLSFSPKASGNNETHEQAQERLLEDETTKEEVEKNKESTKNKVNRFANFCGPDKSLALSQSVTQWSDAILSGQTKDPNYPFKLKDGTHFFPTTSGDATYEAKQVITKKADGSFDVKIVTSFKNISLLTIPKADPNSSEMPVIMTNPETSKAEFTIKLTMDKDGNWSVPEISGTHNIEIDPEMNP